VANRHTDTYNGYQSRVFLWRLHSKAKANHSRQTNNYTAFAPMCATMVTFLMNFLLKSATRNTSRRRSLSAECILCVRVSCLPLGERAQEPRTAFRFSELCAICDHIISRFWSPTELDPQTKLLIRHVCLLSPFRSLRLHHQFSFYRTHTISK
jgi:hypothetical protein